MGEVSSISVLLFVVALVIVGTVAYVPLGLGGSITLGVIVAALVATSVKVASQWERAVVLRLGKYHRLNGPGMFFIIPIIDTIPYWLDLRTITSSFRAEQTLTKDTVPVNVDAILFWKVVDPVKAALEVEDYQNSVSLASQTALRDIIGTTVLADMLAGRQHIDAVLKEIIDERTSPWGIAVQSVEIRDVIIPAALQDAMSRQAQAERERQARVILGQSELQIAQSFKDASKMYENNPTALHLRAMNMLYEGLKDKGALVIVPSSAVETMNLGGMLSLSTLEKSLRKKEKNSKADKD